MVMLLACPLDHNEVFEDCVSPYRQILYVNGNPEEFIQVMCVACGCVLKIKKDLVIRDGTGYKYRR